MRLGIFAVGVLLLTRITLLGANPAWAATARSESPEGLSAESATRAIAVSGPVISVNPVALDFGLGNLGGAVHRDFTVHNVGDQDLEILNLAISDPQVTTNLPQPLTISAGGAYVATATYAPAGGTLAATLTFQSNATNGAWIMLASGHSNTPPAIAPIGSISAQAFVLLAFTVTATDADLDPISLSVEDLPVGATFDALTGAFQWTPLGGDAGAHTLTFAASDGFATDAEVAVITVLVLNRPPVAAPGGPYGGIAGHPVRFDGSASFDPDGDPISYSWDFGDGRTGVGVEPAHSYSAAATFAVTLTVTDAGAGALSQSASTAAVISNPVGRILIAPAGEQASAFFGQSVAPAGDQNGDGFTDVIVGAQGAQRAYVFYGGPGFDEVADRVLTGPEGFSLFGQSAAPAGDFNGDGFVDLIVGARRAGLGGRAYLYYGGPAGDAVADLIFEGVASGDEFGFTVASAGDVNGDGFADVVTGAGANDSAGPNAGRAYVFFGGATADATADLTFTGEAAGDVFGQDLGPGGDVNGDGYSDVVVGSHGNDAGGINAGRAYVYYGGPGADPVADLILTGLTPGSLLGASASYAGDVNGDGFGDLIVGAYGLNRAYLFHGGPQADAVPDLTFHGQAGDLYFGVAVASAGDVNGGGSPDLIVGAFRSSAAGENSGRAYVYFGGPGMDNRPDMILTGEGPGNFFGHSVGSAGDFDGDGFDDVMVGATGNDSRGTDSGRAYVFSAHPPTYGALVDLDPDVVNLDSHARSLTAYVEPSGFDPSSIRVESVRLVGSVRADVKSAILDDHDSNGVPDLMVKFKRETLDPLFALGVNRLTLTGLLVSGENFSGVGEVRVIDPPAGALSAAVAPNPLNPAGVLRFTTTKPGSVRVMLFDVRGRRVRTLVDSPLLLPGSHEAGLDARSEGGDPLATGVYFYRVEAAEGVTAGKFAVLK